MSSVDYIKCDFCGKEVDKDKHFINFHIISPAVSGQFDFCSWFCYSQWVRGFWLKDEALPRLRGGY